MGLLEEVTQKINTSSVATAIITELFPETLAGFLNEYFSDMTARDFYHRVKETEGRGLLSYLDEGTQANLKRMVPEDLGWLNLDWLLKAIANEHRDIACLILSSEYVIQELEKQIDLFKRECK